jgi:hypothetical protein
MTITLSGNLRNSTTAYTGHQNCCATQTHRCEVPKKVTSTRSALYCMRPSIAGARGVTQN